MKLYSYFRSSASYRVRIALSIKGLSYDFQGIHLRRGDQRSRDFLELNPQALVPALVDGDTVITQSLAIIEYLDERFPEPPLLPSSPADRAWVRALSLAVACEIHPVNNLRILQYLEKELGLGEDLRNAWVRHWIEEGFGAVETMLAKDSRTGAFCYRDAPTMADLCLVPQVFNAERFRVDMRPFPTIRRVNDHCMALPAFAEQAPGRQPDAE